MIQLVALILMLVAAAGAAAPEFPRLERDARVVWSESPKRFGGFSAIEVSEDGETFLAISDRGRWARGAFERKDGRLTGARMTGFGALHGIDGHVLRGREVDAEGVAIAPDGSIYVSFEMQHRIRRFTDIDGPAEGVPPHPDFRGLQPNSALEALAVDDAGTIYAIPERSGQMTRPFPVYRYRGGVWDKKLSIPREGRFLVTGADFGPDGRLYVLERDFSWMGGFSNRVRRFDLGPEGLTDEATLLETAFGSSDNFEGVSVWRDAEGRTRVTLIADDNFFALQSTAIAEYVLVEG